MTVQWDGQNVRVECTNRILYRMCVRFNNNMLICSLYSAFYVQKKQSDQRSGRADPVNVLQGRTTTQKNTPDIIVRCMHAIYLIVIRCRCYVVVCTQSN